MLINIDQYWSILNNINRPHPPAARRDLYIYHRSILINIDQFEQYWPPSPAGGEICIFTIADQYWSILTALTRRRRDMYIDHQSILINIEQYWPPSPAGGEISILNIDQYWSILINIDQYWTILNNIDLPHPPAARFVYWPSINIDLYLSILINIDRPQVPAARFLYWPSINIDQY